MNREVDLYKLRINIDRLLERLDDLAKIGAIENTDGCSRLALTDEDKEGRDLVVTWMRDLGMDITIDGIGNVVAVWTGPHTDPTLKPVMTGSHIDTVKTGGRYDGNLGVLAGLEVVETLAEAGISTRHPLAVGFFTDEEGSRFPPDMLGSLVYVGGMSLEDGLDTVGIDGAVLGDELERIGYRGGAPCPAVAPHAFVELHIEQGPVLEAEGVTIGAVESVQGISWTEITIKGQSNHAGTTPMHLRRDPGYAAARIATFVRELALELGGRQVATVGQIKLHPNLVNVVAANATITVDLRNTEEAILQQAEQRLVEFCDRLAEDEKVTITTRSLARFEPVVFDPEVVDRVAHTAAELGYSVKRMPSGAGHDAQMLARVCPTAMIFTPSWEGLSHNPFEFTAPEDLEAGTNVLLHVLAALANENGYNK
ncbi:MAG: Zn-dependent hydrolase [Acidimicrobiia bacterium]|nr:Zn-dependent hydrolase [Acidimicrobiia bacterium]MCY4457484.1 Zn-dependent hydrolase [Acidimicrobiaceae bacterium]